jgi:hypothetical protein
VSLLTASQESSLHLVLRLRGGGDNTKAKEMSVAAGGRILQSIVRDPYSARKWNKGATIVFNVQILNALCFEQVTGRAPPPTPISAKSYADQGLPFFDMYEEQSGVSGDFDKVKSVAEVDGEDETHYTYPLKTIKNELFAASAKDTTAMTPSSSESDTIVNPQGPLREFRHISEIEADLANMKIEQD